MSTNDFTRRLFLRVLSALPLVQFFRRLFAPPPEVVCTERHWWDPKTGIMHSTFSIDGVEKFHHELKPQPAVNFPDGETLMPFMGVKGGADDKLDLNWF